MRKQINKVLNKIGLSLEKTRKLEIARATILENVMKTNFKSKVLLSYIKGPFINKLNLEHTNLRECYTAAEIFQELGYNVDVASFWESSDAIDFNSYAVIYGMGTPIEKSLAARKAGKPIIITYATGCSPAYVNHQGALKLHEFYERTGQIITTSSRFAQTPMSLLTLADKIIVLGNDFTRSTFEIEELELPLVNLAAFFYDTYDIDLSTKDFAASQKHILWFGSGGLLHKGLDLAIDAIKEFPDITLHICGANPNEREFFEYYNAELSNTLPNIINHGFLKLESAEFKRMMDSCGALLFPTVSEGGSPSALNILANGGLLPIIPAAAGIDTEDFAITLDDRSLESVISAIREFSELPREQLAARASKAKKVIRKNYSFQQYKETLKQHIIDAISANEPNEIR